METFHPFLFEHLAQLVGRTVTGGTVVSVHDALDPLLCFAIGVLSKFQVPVQIIPQSDSACSGRSSPPSACIKRSSAD